tara:strand:+ start:633 stop:830 length:198 start_codon:yes stop_codon:yes gene_type:complete
MIPSFIVYTLLALLVAYFGRDRKFGFWAYFVLSFIFTPVIAFVIVLASDKRCPAVVETPAEAASA